MSTLQELRKRSGLTQRELAILLGVPDRTIQRWEAGTSTPTARHQKALARRFEITVAELGLSE